MILAAATQATPYSGLTNSDISTDLQSEPTQYIPVTTSSKGTTAAPKDTTELSQDGLNLSRRNQPANENKGEQTPQQTDNSNPGSPTQLSAEEQQAVFKLKQRDLEVKSHEAAHLASAGQYAAGGPSYSYQTGPDGKRYAIGGEVPIDIGKEKTPEQTLQKMRIVRRAALAPANPSSADRSIAATASMGEAEAMREINSPKEEPDDTQSPNNISSSPAEDLPAKNTSRQPQSRIDLQGIYA